MSIEKLIEDLTRSKFWGGLELKFQNGQVVLIRKIETIPTENYEYGRHPKQYEQRSDNR